MNKSILLIAVLAILGGCAKQTFVMDNNAKEMKRNDVFFSEEPFADNSNASEKETHHFFISGIAQGKAINPVKTCGGTNKIAKVESQTTFLNGFLSIITFGIYTPRDVRVYCK